MAPTVRARSRGAASGVVRGRTRAAGRGVKMQPGVRVGPVGRLLVQILGRYPKHGQIAISSGYRPGPGSHHGGLNYKGSPTAAVDIVSNGAAGMRDVAKWLYDKFANHTVELIHTTPFSTDRGFYVNDQRKYPGGGVYSPQTRREHRDHVHFASSKALALKILKRLGAKAPQRRATASLSLKAAAPKKLRLSKRGAAFIAEFEGMSSKLYNDPVGHCTIGIGHLVHRGRCNGNEPAEFKKGITRARAYQLLQRDARRMEDAVRGLGVPLNQNQFDALVSFTYNLGPGWTVQKTGIRDALKAHRYKRVPREMMKWVNAGGKPVPGLIRRRKAEGRLFASGGAPAPPPGKPLPKVINVADVQPGQNNRSVLVVQKALAKAVGLDYSSGPGNFGPRTRKAYAAWQRKCGLSGKSADGRPGAKSLKLLGDKYGFKVRGGGGGARSQTRMPSTASASDAHL